jgi:hypothetical protein
MTVAVPAQRVSSLALSPPGQAAGPAPVEYAVAVDRYLAGASLSTSSRRVYRISLTGWSWALAGKSLPPGRERRGAVPPVIPLALLDDEMAGRRLAAALRGRAAAADSQTVSRELSALRSAVSWWQDMGWISRDPTAGLRTRAMHAERLAPLDDRQLAALFGTAASLREQALWHVLHETGAAAPAVLGLDASAIGTGGRPRAQAMAITGPAGWTGQTCDLLSWLLSGRRVGPVFLTDRRTASGAASADTCPLTRQARLSYRRAAEIFTASTRPLDPSGRGWTLHQLRPASAGLSPSPGR